MLLYHKKLFMKLNKFWIALTWFLAVAWLNETQAQQYVYRNRDNIHDILILPDKNAQENFNDTIETPVTHEDFMNKKTTISNIVSVYWDEALNLIREHLLQEINAIRKKNGKQELRTNEKLQDFAQKRAEYLYNKGILEHWEWENNLQHRLNNSWLNDWNYCLENIWKRQKSINSIVNWQVKSEKHYKTLLFDKASEIWIWIKYIITDKYGNIIEDENKVTSDCVYSTLRVINFIWYDEEN